MDRIKPEMFDKRIVLVSRFPINIDQPRGGVESATVSLAIALMRAGVKDIHVVTLEEHLMAIVREEHGGIHVHRLPRKKWPMILDIFNGPSITILKRYLTQLKPDVVHFQETWGLGVSKLNYPSIFTIHGFDSLNIASERPSFWKLRALCWEFAERLGISRQEIIISIAPYVYDKIKTITHAKVYSIWNPVNQSYFDIERAEIKNKVVYLGWINRRKNPLLIVGAVHQLKQKGIIVNVDLCGEIDDKEYSLEIIRKIQKCELQDQITLCGRLSQTEVKQKLSEAQLMVLPSLQENAPMVIAEAMAAGVPVVASNICGIPNMIRDGVSGLLVEPNDKRALANAMERILTDEELRHSISRASKYDAEHKFHPSAVAANTLAVYNEILSEKSEKKKINILIVVSNFEFGGAQRQIVELVNNIDRTKFNVHICSLSEYTPLAKNIKISVPIHIIRKAHKYDFTVPMRLSGLIKKYQFNVVHSYLFDAEIAARIAMLFLMKRPKIIGSERNSNYQLKKIQLIFLKNTMHLVDLVIANSRSGANFNAELVGIPMERYRVVYNGVDTRKFTPLSMDQARKEIDIDAHANVVGMFASFKEQKNHSLLLQAITKIKSKIPNLKVLLVGDELHTGHDGSTEYKNRIKQLIKELGIEDNCIYLGNCENVESIYPACDVTVLPSLYEGTPNVILESMACGVPVVATNVADNDQIIVDGETGYLIELGDVQRMADCIETLLSNKEQRYAFGTNSRIRILNHFSSRKLAENTEEIYSS